jgi:hypothetical protein
VNLGLPEGFFQPVLPIATIPLVYSVRGVEYGLGLTGWPHPRLQARASLAFEANRYEDLFGSIRRTVRPADLEGALSVLAVGRRDSALRVAADGWVRWPTGVSPFETADPLLASGRGVLQGALGGWASERVGRFSFFQWIHYENASTTRFDRWRGDPVTPSTLRWPAQWHAGFRTGWTPFRRGGREVTLHYELRMRQAEALEFHGVPAVPADRLLYSTGLMTVRVDPELSVDGRLTFFPLELGTGRTRPDFGTLVSIALHYHLR